MLIRNRCPEIEVIDGPPKHRRDLREIVAILVHMCSPEQMAINLGVDPTEPSVVGMARLFRDPRCGTGGHMPYSIGITPAGQIEQARPLTAMTPHAREWNRRALGIVLFGKLDKVPPTGAQLVALAQLLKWLVPALVGTTANVYGHCEPVPLTTGASDAKHVCIGHPSVMVGMPEVRAVTAQAIRNDALAMSQGAGLVIA